MTHNEASKNPQSGINNQPSSEKERRRYETASKIDGVRSLEFYLPKLNHRCEALFHSFQYPRRNFSKDGPVWYENRPIGKNNLQKMMPTISKLAGLSRKYTNHCVTATAMTFCSDSNIPSRHIIAFLATKTSKVSRITTAGQPSHSLKFVLMSWL